MAKADLLKEAEKFKLEVTEENTVKEIQAALDKHYEANPDDKPAPEQSSEAAYFLNTKHSSLRVIVQDEKDPEQIVEEAQFVPYYDTWKGDTVRVGYLRTESAVITKRCEDDPTCESISEKEYNLAIEGDGNKNKPLRRAPTAIA